MAEIDLQAHLSHAHERVAEPAVARRSRPVELVLTRGLELATILITVAQIVVVFAAVFFRYVLNVPIQGSDEIASLLLIWMTFLAGAIALRKRLHPSVPILVSRFPPAVVAHIQVVNRLIELVFFAMVGWLSYRLFALRVGSPSPGGAFDISLQPLALIVGGLAMLLIGLSQLVGLPRRPLLRVLAATAVLVVVGYLGIQGGWLQPAQINSTLLLIGGFALLLALDAPLMIALGFPPLIYLWILGGQNPLILPQRLIRGADNFVLLAIPLFIVAGALMDTGGISRRLVGLAMAIVGHFRGGLAQVTVVGEILFSGISGSVSADVTAMSALLLPAMERAGYKKEEAVAIVSAASAMGILVPPCLLMVILAVIANTSVTALFLGGFLPAFVLAIGLMAWINFKARRENWPVATRASLGEVGRASLQALIPLGMPVLIFGSIFSGAATVTESAVLAVIYAIIAGVFLYRETPLRDLPRIMLDSAVLTSVSMWLIAAASVFSWLLARDQVPQAVANAILSISNTTWFFLLASVVIFTFFAALLEGFPSVIILGPLFYPIAERMGVDLVHYSIIIVTCVGIGLFLPPVGVGLFIACGVAGIKMTSVVRYLVPYLLILFLGLLVVTFVPWITLVIPQALLTK